MTRRRVVTSVQWSSGRSRDAPGVSRVLEAQSTTCGGNPEASRGAIAGGRAERLTGSISPAKSRAMVLSLVRRRSVASALIVAGLAIASTVAAQMKIAVVDTQRAVMETEDGLRAQAKLKKLFEERQKELDGKQNQLQKEREDIEKQQGVVSQAALQKRVEVWQQEMMQLQAVFVDYNKELQKKQNELTQPIVQKTMGLIRRIATQDGYDLIVEKQVTPYFRSDLDLTDRLITAYNSGAAVGAGAPAPAREKSAGTPPVAPVMPMTPPAP